MRGLLQLLLVVATVWLSDVSANTTPAPLKCRRCIGANSLDDCTFSIPCSKGEICFMDEVITEQLTIEYNGGCRPRDVCIRGSPVGKKRAGSLTACSKCCEEKGQGAECNTKLCGIKSANSNTQQCYHCASESAGGAGVTDPNKCTTLVSCQTDQVCGSETFRLSTKETYEFKCIQQTLCTLLTQEALKELKRCDEDPGSISCKDLAAGKRESSGYKTCTACCGDSQCNSEDCESMKERLYLLWKGGVLDFETLTQNGTIPDTTVAPAGQGVTTVGQTTVGQTTATTTATNG